ncbi:20067_t:CDS:2, partial [Funneliformis geosporum]
MPSKSAIQKKLEQNRTFHTERKTENLQEQLARLCFSLCLEEQKRLLADELLEVHQSLQELREEKEDRDNTILLLRDCEEELLMFWREGLLLMWIGLGGGFVFLFWLDFFWIISSLVFSLGLGNSLNWA